MPPGEPRLEAAPGGDSEDAPDQSLGAASPVGRTIQRPVRMSLA